MSLILQFVGWAKAFYVPIFAGNIDALKQVKHFGQDYFDEMLERVREIRVSERRFYAFNYI